MQQPKPIPGRISPGARKILTEFLEHAGSRQAVICLLKGRAGESSEEKWGFGTYEPENIRSLERHLAGLGHCLLYELDRMVVAIPQFDKLDEIIGKEMIWNDRELGFRDYSP